MQEVIIVVGFPGSGKTTLLKRMSSSPEYSDYAFFDNVFGGSGGPERFLEALQNGKSAITSDIQFTKATTLEKFVSKIPTGIPIKYHYFSNNPEQCKKNCITRNTKDVKFQLEYIAKRTPTYAPIDPKPVWGEA
jgi:GTPase SAR1 family protein